MIKARDKFGKRMSEGIYYWYVYGTVFRWPGGMNHTPSATTLAEEGYLPLVDTPHDPATEKLGAYKDDGVEITQHIVAMTQEEQDAYQDEQDAILLAEANEALLTLMVEVNAELAFWNEKTPAEITEIITNSPNTFAGFKQLIEKNAQANGLIVKVLKLLRETGRI